MKQIFALPVLLATLPAHADQVYLLIKSVKGDTHSGGVALHSIPMKSIEQCEENGALLISSQRFKVNTARFDTFECVQGQ